MTEPPLHIQLGTLIAVAVGLLVADRILRIQPFLNSLYGGAPTDGFQDRVRVNGTTSRLGARCGVDVGGCPEGLRCGNGFCIEQEPPHFTEDREPVPVLP